MALRLILVLAGAAGLIVSAFMDWIRGTTGVNLTIRSLYQPRFGNSSTFVLTVGFVAIVLGLLAIIGLAGRSGWLSRVAGALGIAAFVLFVIEVYRANLTVNDLDAGAWVALGGSVLALIGGFFGPRPVAVET